MIVNFLYDKNGKLTNYVEKGNICFLDKKVKVNLNDKVSKTSDSSLIEEISNFEPRKIPVKLSVVARNNELLVVSYDDVSLKGNIVQHAHKRPTTKDEIIRSLSKLGNTHFYVEDIDASIDDDIFISVSELNDLRRRCISILTDNKTSVGLKNDIYKVKKNELKISVTNDISVLVRNEELLKYLLTKNVNIIYVTDYKLYKKYKDDKRVFYRVSRVSDYNKYEDERLLVSDNGSLYKNVVNNFLVSDAYMNISNSLSLYYMHKLGVKKVTLSVECDYENIRRTIKDYVGKYKYAPNVEVVVYGKPELMIMKYDLLGKYINGNTNNNEYYLEDRVGEKYKLIKSDDITYVMHYKNIDMLDDIDYLKSLGVTNFRIDLLDESKEMVDEILHELNI